MNRRLAFLSFLLVALRTSAAPVPLFDGRSLDGWEGDPKLWRVEEGMITGGSLTEKIPHNDFLATVKSYANFDLRLKIKLSGDPTTGMINSGVQMRSLRVPGSPEMSGYQVDYGKGWYGKLYDESRRNKVIAESKDMKAATAAIKEGDWNEYRIRTEGAHIQSWINGVPALDYLEEDPNAAQDGHIGIQVHGGGKVLVQVKDVTIEELPATPNAPTWEKLGGVEGVRAKLAPPKKSADAAPAPKRDLSYNAVATTAKTPDEERATFKLPDGFEVELIAAEDPANGIGKFVPIAFDQHGALWTTTAFEYPVDGNENPAAADALYASKAKDRVLVYDRDPKSLTGYATKPRVFLDGLAIPLGVLPYKNGCYVLHGHDIVFAEDTDADGKADKTTVILTGFGVQDSHLFPHQFMRAPGGWIWMAQGAFNYSRVSRPGDEKNAVQFDQTRMAKFRPDGSGFDITSNGPCNIWGLVLDGEGEAFIQEANDFGYPVMPFHEYANYPGCSDRQWKSYAPEFPGTAPDFRMGGTGLSGLAILDEGWVKLLDGLSGADAAGAQKQTLSSRAERSGVENRSAAEMAAGEGGRKPLTSAGGGGAEQQRQVKVSSAPPPPPDARGSSTPLRSAQNDRALWTPASQTVLVANPITNRIQAIVMHRDGPYWKLDPPTDFLVSSDPWFRPVAITTGPDGCLYIVDWYNKIISHNEVPRNHPDRDKTRGRIWRVKATATKPFDVPDFTKLSGDELIAKLGGDSLTQSHLAWQAIVDRRFEHSEEDATRMVRNLEKIIRDSEQSAARRIQALWAIAGIDGDDVWITRFPKLLSDPSRNMRRELVRLDETMPFYKDEPAEQLASSESDPEVRFQIIKTVRTQFFSEGIEGFEQSLPKGIQLLLAFARAPLAEPVASSTKNGKPIKVREAYDREFERYLVRMFLERQPDAVAKFLDSDAANPLPVEARLLASLALEPKASAARVAKLLPQLQRAPGQEEVLRLAQFPDEPGVGDALKALLANPATRVSMLDALLAVRTRLDAAKLAPMLTDAARELLGKDYAAQDLGIQLATAFKLTGVEPALLVLANGERELPARPAGLPSPGAGDVPASGRTLPTNGALNAPGRDAGGSGQVARAPLRISAVRALAEIGSTQSALFAKLAESSPDLQLRDEALAALAASKAPDAPAKVLALYPQLATAQRHTALDRLSTTKPGAAALVAALAAKTIPTADLDGPTLDRLQTVLGPKDPELAKLIDSLGNLFRPVLALDGSEDAWVETQLTFDGPLTVETWVRLTPEGRKIGNSDGILGVPGKLDLNFFDSKLRVYAGGTLHDVIVAKKPVAPDMWTHVAAVRDADAKWKLYINGELDNGDCRVPAPGALENVRIGWTGAKGGTQGALAEYRVWNRARTADEIRRDFDRSFGAEKPPGLVFQNSGGGEWGKLQKGASVAKTSDLPPILTPEQALALDGKFSKYRALAAQPGDVVRGKKTALLCQACHLFGKEGGNIGPVLSSVGAMGTEAILRNIITPNAAMENGYRIFRVEKTDGSIVEAFFVSEDKNAVVIRLPGAGDQRIERKDIRSTKYLRRSLMPEGILDTMTDPQASDLFAYLLSLK